MLATFLESHTFQILWLNLRIAIFRFFLSFSRGIGYILLEIYWKLRASESNFILNLGLRVSNGFNRLIFAYLISRCIPRPRNTFHSRAGQTNMISYFLTHQCQCHETWRKTKLCWVTRPVVTGLDVSQLTSLVHTSPTAMWAVAFWHKLELLLSLTRREQLLGNLEGKMRRTLFPHVQSLNPTSFRRHKRERRPFHSSIMLKKEEKIKRG